MKKTAFIICLALSFSACKKNEVNKPEQPPPASTQTHLKLPPGALKGNAVTKEIGIAGGSLQSSDGIISVSIPSGAVDQPVSFSIQQVENTLGSKGRSYRLRPEGVNFKKPVTITYAYGGLDFGLTDPKYLYLAFQDENGYFYSAKNTKCNKINHTLTVETTHFSDWTFYTMYEFEVNAAIVDGKVQLREDESVELVIKKLVTKPTNGPFDELLTPLYDPVTSATWDLIPKKGTLIINNVNGRATYRAPKVISSEQEVIVTAMLKDVVAKDNEDNPIRMMQLSQPIALKTGDYFTLSENGEEVYASDFGVDLIPGFSVDINAKFPTGANLSCHAWGDTPASYTYKNNMAPKTAMLELVTSDKESFIVFRPDNCDQPKDLFFSPGSFILTSVANSAGQYVEGNYTATLYHFDYCGKGNSKTISGKFRIKRKS